MSGRTLSKNPVVAQEIVLNHGGRIDFIASEFTSEVQAHGRLIRLEMVVNVFGCTSVVGDHVAHQTHDQMIIDAQHLLFVCVAVCRMNAQRSLLTVLL